MDLAYFKHLRYLGDSLGSSDSEAVGGRGPLTFTMRLKLSGPWISKNRIALCTNCSQMKGVLSAHQVIDLLESGQWLTWFYQVNPPGVRSRFRDL